MRFFKPVFDDEKPEVNLTPMLDVVFIMLVFFVVTATFLRESGIPVALPFAESIPDDIESISVTVERASTFLVNNRAMSKSSLKPYLHALFAQNPDASFSVIVTRGSRVKDTVIAADAGRALGFDVIPIIEQEP